MSTITVQDGTQIFVKDWGSGDPLVFHHGWPLSADDWDAQLMFFLREGYRVIAFDRRGHGRSTQTDGGHDMDTYASDVAALVEALHLRGAIHIGHSTGGGEVARYVARCARQHHVKKAVLISAVPPLMLKTEKYPGGIGIETFDLFRANTAGQRASFYYDLTVPFYGFNRPGAQVSEAIRNNWWRQGMMGGIKAHYDGIKAFSETDFHEDLQSIDIPVLVMHGEDDQIVPFANAGPLSAKLLRNGKTKFYPGFPHGMATTHAEQINADILEFIRSEDEHRH